ncbi:HPP family protein [Aureimonas sp. AU12]|uniref:HPP family protein n=1 Tax=Aureimonas sp. AU12 TaxID=1638161 RepID=UPI000785C23F|nr:HPP family protein [Aureimonas sp. AU12]
MPMRLRSFLPEPTSVSLRERVRAALGALVGILATGLVSRTAIGDVSALPALIAPMGASAVLLFAVPASPLAQPWSIVGGNLVSAAIGVAVAGLLPDPLLAAGLAIGLAIACMTVLRCLHPPSGAVALTAVLGGPAIHALGYGFVLWPVLANSLLLLACALAFNNLTGRPYPNAGARKPIDHGTADPAPGARAGFLSDDLDAVLRDYDQLLDVSRADLEAILRQAQMRSYRRRAGGTLCADVMSRDVIAIAPDASLKEAFELLRAHHIKALPVTDDSARVLGIVTQTDLLDKAVWDRRGPRLGTRHRIQLSLGRGRAPSGSVEDIMTTPVETVSPDASVAAVVSLMSEAGLHHLPVVGPDRRLVGIVSQTDLVMALLADAADAAAPIS